MLLKADRLFHTSYHSQAVHIRPVCRVSLGGWETGAIPGLGEKVQVKHVTQCLLRAEPVVSGRRDDDDPGLWSRTKETERKSLSWSLVVMSHSRVGTSASSATFYLT